MRCKRLRLHEETGFNAGIRAARPSTAISLVSSLATGSTDMTAIRLVSETDTLIISGKQTLNSKHDLLLESQSLKKKCD